MKKSLFTPLLCAASLIALPVFALDIETVMKEAMKGETSLYKTVALGKGTDADNAKLLEYVKGLQGQKTPKGDQAAYDAKVTKLVKATEDVVAKKPGALEHLQLAGNCKGCHRDHKPD